MSVLGLIMSFSLYLRSAMVHFKIQWEIPFFDFLNIGRNSSKKNWNRNMDIRISNLLSKSILDFGKWSNGKYANTCICVFSVWPLPEVQNWFRKQIWNENVNISILNFFPEEFRPIFKKSQKMDCPLYFKNVISKWPKVF